MGWAARGGAAGYTPRLGAGRVRRRLSTRGRQGPAPTERRESPAPRRILYGQVQALTLFQARQGLDQRPPAAARLHRNRRTFQGSVQVVQVDTLFECQGGLQARRARGGGGSP